MHASDQLLPEDEFLDDRSDHGHEEDLQDHGIVPEQRVERIRCLLPDQRSENAVDELSEKTAGEHQKHAYEHGLDHHGRPQALLFNGKAR